MRDRAAQGDRQGAGGALRPESDHLDDDGVDLAKPHRISASLEVNGDTLHFILDSDAQARGPVNLRPCVSRNSSNAW